MPRVRKARDGLRFVQIGQEAAPLRCRRRVLARPRRGWCRSDRRRGSRLGKTRARLLAVADRVHRLSLERAKRSDARLRMTGPGDTIVPRSMHAPARHDQLASGAMRSSRIDADLVGRSYEPHRRRERAGRLARSFGLELEPTCTARSFAAARSTLTARTGDNQRCKLQLHRRATYLYWHTLSAVPSPHRLPARTKALPPELAGPAHEPSSNPS